jgi:hypothetical protein
MADKKRVYVYETGDPFVPYRVFPAVTILKKNDSIELVNTTDDEAVWEVPAGLLDDAAIRESVPRKSQKSKEAKKDGPQAGTYKVHVDGSRAHAHSDPVIIIDT